MPCAARTSTPRSDTACSGSQWWAKPVLAKAGCWPSLKHGSICGPSRDEAARRQREALVLQQKLGNRVGICVMLNNLAENSRLRGDYAPAVDGFRQALTIAREIGNLEDESMYLAGLGSALAGVGEFEQAEAVLREAASRAAEQREKSSLTYASLFLGETLARQGRPAEAMEEAWHALAMARTTGLRDVEAGAWRLLGEVMSQGDTTAAGEPISAAAPVAPGDERLTPEACFRKSLDMCAEMGAEAERARTLAAWARYALECGDVAHADELFQEAREILAGVGIGKEVEPLAPALSRHSARR